MERREAPGGLRDPLWRGLRGPACTPDRSKVCETCSAARAPARAGFARPDAAALRLPALHHRTGDRPARLSRGALSAPRPTRPPRRVMTAPDQTGRDWEYMLPVNGRQDYFPHWRKGVVPAKAGTYSHHDRDIASPVVMGPGPRYRSPGPTENPVPNLFLDPPPPCIKQCP